MNISEFFERMEEIRSHGWNPDATIVMIVNGVIYPVAEVWPIHRDRAMDEGPDQIGLYKEKVAS